MLFREFDLFKTKTKFHVGSAHVFTSADGVSGWSQVSKLVASTPYGGVHFGYSVSVWSNVIVVGAINDGISPGVFPGERVVENSVCCDGCIYVNFFFQLNYCVNSLMLCTFFEFMSRLFVVMF